MNINLVGLRLSIDHTIVEVRKLNRNKWGETDSVISKFAGRWYITMNPFWYSKSRKGDEFEMRSNVFKRISFVNCFYTPHVQESLHLLKWAISR